MMESNDTSYGEADNGGETAEMKDTNRTAEDANSHKKPEVEYTDNFLDADNLEYEIETTDRQENEDRVAKRRASQLRASRHGIILDGTPFDVSFHPGRLKFYGRPRQRQNWSDTQVLPRVNWGDLFFDLYYVAAAYNVSSLFQLCIGHIWPLVRLMSLDTDIQHLGGFSHGRRLLVFSRNLLAVDGHVDRQDLLRCKVCGGR
jgi:hypothetical protein